MKVPKKPGGRTPRRNPHARALGEGIFRVKVVKNPKGYIRKPKHPKPAKTDEES